MRLGLVGTGPQAQRYLMPKNGGAHIVKQIAGHGDASELDGLDGVIIATHPNGHRRWAVEAVKRFLPMLIEKPLALSLDECESIISMAEFAGVPMHVAHLDQWAWTQPLYPDPNAYCVVNYREHKRDYSAWLDWAPHALALLDRIGACRGENVCLDKGEGDSLVVFSSKTGGVHYQREPTLPGAATPMLLAVRDIRKNGDNASLRRVYRALFAQENHATR
jgi:hypothetical protein